MSEHTIVLVMFGNSTVQESQKDNATLVFQAKKFGAPTDHVISVTGVAFQQINKETINWAKKGQHIHTQRATGKNIYIT